MSVRSVYFLSSALMISYMYINMQLKIWWYGILSILYFSPSDTVFDPREALILFSCLLHWEVSFSNSSIYTHARYLYMYDCLNEGLHSLVKLCVETLPLGHHHCQLRSLVQCRGWQLKPLYRLLQISPRQVELYGKGYDNSYPTIMRE